MSGISPGAYLLPTTRVSDGTGRDMYVRRDPTQQYGKLSGKDFVGQAYTTRLGAAGSALPRDRSTGYAGFTEGERDMVGGPLVISDTGERSARFLRKPYMAYPVAVSHYSTMKDIVQDAHVTATWGEQKMLNEMKPTQARSLSYTGFKPRYPTTQELSSWATLK